MRTHSEQGNGMVYLSDDVHRECGVNACLSFLVQEQFLRAVDLIKCSREKKGTTEKITDVMLTTALFANSGPHRTGLVEGAPKMSADHVVQFCDALLKAGECQTASEVLKKSKALHPHHFLIRVTLARAFQQSGEKLLAKQELDVLTSKASAPDETRLLYYLCLDLEAFDSAVLLVTQLLRKSPEDTSLRRSFIDILFKRKEYDAAWEELRFLASSKAATAEDFYFVARKCLSRNNKSIYILACEAAQLAINAGFKHKFLAETTLIQAQIKAGRHKVANDNLVKLHRVAKTSNEFAEIAELWMSLGYQENALTMARRGVAADTLSHEHPLPRLRLADVLSVYGKKEESRKLLLSIEWNRIKEKPVLRRFHETCIRNQLEFVALESGKYILEQDPYDQRLMQQITLLTIECRVANHAPTVRSAKLTAEKKGFIDYLFGPKRKM